MAGGNTEGRLGIESIIDVTSSWGEKSGRCLWSSWVSQILHSPIVLSISKSDIYRQITTVDLMLGGKCWYVS